jgi:hypothetical protein
VLHGDWDIHDNSSKRLKVDYGQFLCRNECKGQLAGVGGNFAIWKKKTFYKRVSLWKQQ